ncbi:hypothetical protein KIF59_14555 [Enterobacter cloacae subsp. cloacae]|nr:hypothetical protein [Enterobacter cloacae subsp. cloacae]
MRTAGSLTRPQSGACFRAGKRDQPAYAPCGLRGEGGIMSGAKARRSWLSATTYWQLAKSRARRVSRQPRAPGSISPSQKSTSWLSAAFGHGTGTHRYEVIIMLMICISI